MFAACLPFGPGFTSKLTFWPSWRVLKPWAWISEKCAKRSSLPSSGVMNPKPFASLNHFTVPVAIFWVLQKCCIKVWHHAFRQGVNHSMSEGSHLKPPHRLFNPHAPEETKHRRRN